MKTKWMAALLLSLTITCAAAAEGAPESQFGYSGWPYRQNTECNTATGDRYEYNTPPVMPPKPPPPVRSGEGGETKSRCDQRS